MKYEPDKVAKAGFHVAKSEYMVKKRRERNGFPSFFCGLFSQSLGFGFFVTYDIMSVIKY